MIISDYEKFVFIHNPKVGGMTFRTALAKYDTRDNFFFEWKAIEGTEDFLDMAHITIFQLYKFYPQIAVEIDSYFRFGFVRNPYYRFLSAVSQHLKLGDGRSRSVILANPDLFYGVASGLAEAVLFPQVVESDFKLVHFRRQSNYFWHKRKRWIGAVMKLEELNLSAPDNVRHWLGNSFDTSLNRTEQIESYNLDRLSKAAMRSISDFYAPDFDRFDYPRWLG